jgi:hypothetical protein
MVYPITTLMGLNFEKQKSLRISKAYILGERRDSNLPASAKARRQAREALLRQ